MDKNKKIGYCDICSYQRPVSLFTLRDEAIEIIGYITICNECLKLFKI